MEAQHGDINFFSSFYHDYLLFIIHDLSFFVLFSFQFCSEKVDPKPDIRMGISLCYSVGAVEACSCSATISFVRKQNCSNLPMVMSDKHLNQGATCRIRGYLAGMWQCCLTTCLTRAQIAIALPETVLPWAVWVILIAPIFFQLMRHWNYPSCHTEERAESRLKWQAESVKFAHLVAVLFRTSSFVLEW